MTDYKSLKLIASSNPHIRAEDNTQSIMMDVIVAMMPALIWSCFQFGIKALLLTAVSAAGCVFFEWLYRHLLKKPQSIGDLSAVVTGMLLAFVCPPTTPYWMILIGDLFAIVFVKQIFGGIGMNFVNPALAGRAFLLSSYSSAMTTWLNPAVAKAPILGGGADAVTAATPLSFMKGSGEAVAESFASLMNKYSILDLFLGRTGGSLGEVSALVLIIGGVYLIVRKVISWHTPVSYIATVAVLTFLFPKAGTNVEWMLYSLFGGGLMLGAFFMATDYATSPVTHMGQVIYGIGCGLFTVFIRYFGSYNEGVCYSILVMNLFVPLIDRAVKPTRFGVVKSDKAKS